MDTTGYCKLCGKIKRHFCCQTCYEKDATKSMKKSEMAEELRTIKAAIEDIKYYVGNPSAWEHYDDGVSEKIRAILKAAGIA